MTREDILKGAIKCVCNDREAQYGSPEDSFETISRLWSIYLGVDVTAHDVGVLMSLLKIGRIKEGRFKDDSYVDACGYLACAGEIASKNSEKTIAEDFDILRSKVVEELSSNNIDDPYRVFKAYMESKKSK